MIETPKGSQVIDEKSGGKFLDNAEVEIDDVPTPDVCKNSTAQKIVVFYEL